MTTNSKLTRLGYSLAFIFLLTYIVLTLSAYSQTGSWFLMLFFLALALTFRMSAKLKGFTFTTMIFAAVSLAMYYPQYFIHIGTFKFSRLIIPLLQIIMFGMGCELSWKELVTVIKQPKAIMVGIICHYTIMPFIGLALANLFNFPKEIAAGIILVGCCPSGLASNVMSYLAKANLALSISVTAISNLLSPLLTPLLMHLLAGKFVTVNFGDMVLDTTKVVLIPILAGLLFNFLIKGESKWPDKMTPIISMAGFGAISTFITLLGRKIKLLDKLMPIISMAGIGVIIVVITAAGRDNLLKVGLLLILAVVIHNVTGYTFGYWLSRLLGFKERDCRTISLEVGMQNSGLASGLALLMGGMATIGLAPAIFGPFMNISGSSLATWWHARNPKEDADALSG